MTRRHSELEGHGKYPHWRIDNAIGPHADGQFGYDDVLVRPNATKRPAASAPTWTAWKTSLELLEFAQDDYVTFDMQFPHTREAGTPIYFHVHFVNNNGSIADGETVKWRLGYSHADIGEEFPAYALANYITYTSSGVTATDTHCMTAELEVPWVPVSYSSIGEFRLTYSTTSTYADDVGLLSCDFHIQKSRIGNDHTVTE